MPKKSSHSTPAQGSAPDQIGMDRLVFFSDAVFAIAITLLSLEIRLPATENSLSEAEMLQAILALWPKYMAYVISFMVIGLFWIAHHRKFRLIQRYDRNLMLLNLLFLLFIAFIPFPTSLISEQGNRTATIFYALVIMMAGLLSILLWLYASSHTRLINPNTSAQQRQREWVGPLLTMGIFAISIGVAFLNANLARLVWVLVFVMLRFYR